MPTITHNTGLEFGGPVSTAGGGLFGTISGTPTIQSGSVRSGVYALQCAPAGAAVRAGLDFTARNDIVWRFYVRLSGAPAADCTLAHITAADGQNGELRFRQSDGVLVVDIGSTAQTGPLLVTQTWYRIDIKAVFNTNPHTLDCQIHDGTTLTTLTQATNAVAGSTCSGVRFGTGGADTFTAQYDDSAYSFTVADYPLGAGQGVGLSPVSDGVHNAGTNIMEDAAGTDIGSASAWSLLDDVPINTGASPDRVQQTANGASNYAAIVFGAIPSASSIGGVMGLLAYQSATATANNGATMISHDAFSTSSSIFGSSTCPADMSEASEFYKSASIIPPGGGWLGTETLTARIGYSTDAAPDPYWHALMVEVDYVPAAAGAGDGLIRGQLQAMGIIF